MKLVKTDEARPGQKAARDVTDLRGNLLFKAGTDLTPEMLALCKERTISHLFIEDAGSETPASPVDVQARKESVMRDIDHMFAGTENSPIMVSLKEASRRYLSAKMSK
jgi:hypothetical protein